MAQSYYNTDILLASLEKTHPTSGFLKDRYFPAADDSVFATEDVLIEYKDGSRKMAPFVHPRKDGVIMERDGYQTERYTPADVKPKRPLTIDDLKKKGFGEALFKNTSPAEREALILAKDIKELDEGISRREECMAAETLLTSGCVMKHLIDENADKYDEREIRFYSEASNPNIYTPTNLWGSGSADIIGDLEALIELFATKGLPFEDLIVGGNVAKTILKDANILKLLDNRRYELGQVAPVKLGDGVSQVATLNILGNNINILSYQEKYVNDAGALVPFIPSGKIIATAPGAGKIVYGAVTQMEQADGQFHTYAGKRVPKYLADATNNVRTIGLTSRPLLIPNYKGSWISATVL